MGWLVRLAAALYLLGSLQGRRGGGGRLQGKRQPLKSTGCKRGGPTAQEKAVKVKFRWTNNYPAGESTVNGLLRRVRDGPLPWDVHLGKKECGKLKNETAVASFRPIQILGKKRSRGPTSALGSWNWGRGVPQV